MPETGRGRRLAGRVALISGAARGQGTVEARLFAAEGAAVVLGDLLDEPGAAVAAEIGDSAAYVHLDVTREEAWRAAVELTRARYGHLDVLVNNAGILCVGSIETLPLEDFEGDRGHDEERSPRARPPRDPRQLRAPGRDRYADDLRPRLRGRPRGSPGEAPDPAQGVPADVAALVLFLASDESAYCTGAEFVVDGGATAG